MDDGANRQVAAVPLRTTQRSVEVLLVTSSAGRWILPKGNLDAGRTPTEMAAAEALEEAGVIGTAIKPPLGRFAYNRAGRLHRVEVYPLLVERILPRWKEQHQRERKWVPLDRAPAVIQIRALARIVADLASDPDRARTLCAGARHRRTA